MHSMLRSVQVVVHSWTICFFGKKLTSLGLISYKRVIIKSSNSSLGMRRTWITVWVWDKKLEIFPTKNLRFANVRYSYLNIVFSEIIVLKHINFPWIFTTNITNELLSNDEFKSGKKLIRPQFQLFCFIKWNCQHLVVIKLYKFNQNSLLKLLEEKFIQYHP